MHQVIISFRTDSNSMIKKTDHLRSNQHTSIPKGRELMILILSKCKNGMIISDLLGNMETMERM